MLLMLLMLLQLPPPCDVANTEVLELSAVLTFEGAAHQGDFFLSFSHFSLYFPFPLLLAASLEGLKFSLLLSSPPPTSLFLLQQCRKMGHKGREKEQKVTVKTEMRSNLI